MDTVRIDKWLWAARFFKTRALAAKACELGRIESNSITAKASRDVRVGDALKVRCEGGEFLIEVLGLSEMRGPAAVAQLLYREGEESKERRRAVAEERKHSAMFDLVSEGKPNKRDRRVIDRFRGR